MTPVVPGSVPVPSFGTDPSTSWSLVIFNIPQHPNLAISQPICYWCLYTKGIWKIQVVGKVVAHSRKGLIVFSWPLVPSEGAGPISMDNTSLRHIFILNPL